MLYYKILDIKDFDCINIKKLFLLLLINIYKNSNNNLMLKDKSSIIKNPLLFYDINNYKYDFGKGTKRLKLILKHLRYLCVKIKSERTLSRVTLKTILFYLLSPYKAH